MERHSRAYRWLGHAWLVDRIVSVGIAVNVQFGLAGQ